MKLLENVLIPTIIKKGVFYEAKHFKADIEMPETNMVVKINIDNMTIKIEKSDED